MKIILRTYVGGRRWWVLAFNFDLAGFEDAEHSAFAVSALNAEQVRLELFICRENVAILCTKLVATGLCDNDRGSAARVIVSHLGLKAAFASTAFSFSAVGGRALEVLLGFGLGANLADGGFHLGCVESVGLGHFGSCQ